ncbi:hypothetical protein OG226_21170 [Streptomyces sp. NBC_01261]|uniref:hypothetical protein n=1 Tax=unclassified Streptomyces TaxID=2593676 RepID=UPI002E2D3324|nr:MULTISPECIES: hypothetical protein [unclassified Streptomyces]
MSAAENQCEQARRYAFAGVSMRELLAAGDAALAVSTPPRAPEPVEVPGEQRQRKAA